MMTENEWTQVIRPAAKWFDLRFGELWRYRDLILLLFYRDFSAKFRQTVLGPAWYILQPLFTAGVFTIVFGNVAGLPTDGLPKFLFYTSGIVVWRYFSDCLTRTSDTFTANRALFGKVYFPRLAVPVSVLLTNLVAFFIQFVFFLCVMAYFFLAGTSFRPNTAILLFPFLLLLMAMLGLGGGIIISSATSKYRDLQNLVQFGVQLLMYAAPVIYPVSGIPDKYRWILLANPMTSVIEAFRYGFLGAGTVSVGHLFYSAVFGIIVLLIGVAIFSRIERTVMDTV